MTSRSWLNTAAATAVGAVSVALVLAAPGHALDDCGVGMYYNEGNGQCEPWAPVGVGFAPAVAAAVPVVNLAPVGIDFDPVPAGIGFDVGFGFNVPNIAPYLRVPGVPGIPGIHVPGVPVPGIPDIRVPQVPDVRIPPVHVPVVPDVHIPAPQIHVPEVHAPEFHPRR